MTVTSGLDVNGNGAVGSAFSMGPFYPHPAYTWRRPAVINRVTVPSETLLSRPAPMVNGPGPGIVEFGVAANYEQAYRLMPQVPLGWARPNLTWNDNQWQLDFSESLETGTVRPGVRRGSSVANGSNARRIVVLSDGAEQIESKAGVHRWELETVDRYRRVPAATVPIGVPSTGPVFGADRRWFGNLMSHAPGLNTLASDVLALAEAEVRGDDAEKNLGTIDGAARRLINKARSGSWQKVTFPAEPGAKEFSILVDGSGRHVYHRSVAEGLDEDVICDGQTLRHVYAELGLAAERDFSRFHAQGIRSLIPWLLPSVEELAIGCDVLATGKRTVVVRPLRADSKTEDSIGTPDEPDNSDQQPAMPQLETHLVFSKAGQLRERRLVESSSDRILLKVVYTTDGLITIRNEQDKVIAETMLKVENAEAPDLTIDKQEIVSLPFPVRSSKTILTTEDGSPNVAAYSSWSKRELLRLVMAYLAENNAVQVVRIMHEHFIAKGDKRDGLYVLLSRFPKNLKWEENVPESDGRRRSIDLRPSAEGSVLRQFLRQYIRWQQQPENTQPDFELAGSDDGFVRRMATAANLYHRWSSGRATEDQSQQQIAADLVAALEFAGSCQSDSLAWTVLSVVQPRVTSKDLSAAVADALERFDDNPVLGTLARLTRVRSLFDAGKSGKARKEYRELLKDIAKQGGVPRIDADIREHFQEADENDLWDALLDELSDSILKTAGPRAAFVFSVELRKLGDTEAANDLLNAVLKVMEKEPQADVQLLAVEQLKQLKDGRANTLLDTVLQSEQLAASAELWRYAADVADSLGRKQSALIRLEHAIQLEFESRPEVINVEQLRMDYVRLFARYRAVIEASETLEKPLPTDLFARIIRSADQWRSLEDDDTTCCHATADLLARLDKPTLRWAYLTTPLVGHSGESSCWQQLAQHLSGNTEDFERADIAWSRAFECEQTNPDILLKHAEFLARNGRAGRRKELLTKIVNSNWQSRFSTTQQKARHLLEN